MANYEYVLAYHPTPFSDEVVEVERISGDVDEKLVEQYRFCKCKVYGWFCTTKKEKV